MAMILMTGRSMKPFVSLVESFPSLICPSLLLSGPYSLFWKVYPFYHEKFEPPCGPDQPESLS